MIIYNEYFIILLTPLSFSAYTDNYKLLLLNIWLLQRIFRIRLNHKIQTNMHLTLQWFINFLRFHFTCLVILVFSSLTALVL